MEDNPFDFLANNDWEPSDENEFVEKMRENIADEPVTDHDLAIFVQRAQALPYERLLAGAVAFEIAFREAQATKLHPTRSVNEFLKLIGEFQMRTVELENKIRTDFIVAEDKKWRAENPEKAAAQEARLAAEQEEKAKLMEQLLGNIQGNGAPAPQSIEDIFGGSVDGLVMPEEPKE